jgi:tetratricopeptide (TPR) repeat protein
MTTANPIIGTKTGRARRTLGQLWQIPTFLLGLFALIGVAASSPWRHSPQWLQFDRQLQSLRQDLASDANPDALAADASNALLYLTAFPDRAAEVHFLAGAACFRQAQQKPAPIAKELWTQAVEHLEKSLALGPLESDLPALRYRLGYALCKLDKDRPRGIELLTRGLDKTGPQALDGQALLVEMHLKGPKPNVDAALAASRRVLDLSAGRDADLIAAARLQHAELLVRKELRDDAIRELEQIGSKTVPAIRIKARLLQARACEEEGRWQNAIALWQELRKDANQVEGGRAFVAYRLGCCYREIKGNHADCIAAWSEALNLGGPAGQAAGIQLGELRLSIGGPEMARALADWSQALAGVKAPDDFGNPFLDRVQVQKIFDHALREFGELQDAEKMQAVAELYRKITSGGVAELRVAQSAEAFAKHLARSRQEKVGNVKEEGVLVQYRRAGQAYENAAKASPDDAAELLWRGIECLLLAKDMPTAQVLLLQYVEIEKAEDRLAQGWFTIGDLYRADGQTQKAHTAFVKCREFPNTPFACRANYYLAVEEMDKKNYDRARTILSEILTGPSNQIDRPSHEKALYTMASLLVAVGSYAEAEVYMKDCLRLYPENAGNLLMREQLGECYRKLAEKEMGNEAGVRKLLQSTIPDDRRQQLEEALSQHRQKRKRLLLEAVKTYQTLADELELQGKVQPLSPMQQTLIRRAWFGIGDCHLDNEEYSEALRVFQLTQTKYRRTIESFYSSWRLCGIVEALLPQTNDIKLREMAMDSLNVLLEDIKVLPADHEVFNQPRAPNRTFWIRHADDTQKRLLAAPKKDRPGSVFP